jgi:hypothetical protein
MPVLHWSPAAEQSRAAPEQAPAVQASLRVHHKPSLQAVPLASGWASHTSPPSLHTPALHWSPAAEQSRATPPQAPPVQTSVTEQNKPSSQAVPSGLAWGTQASEPSEQIPSLQALPAPEQSRAEPAQAPAVQTSLIEQNRPSSQLVPSALGCGTHASVPSSQTPSLH